MSRRRRSASAIPVLWVMFLGAAAFSIAWLYQQVGLFGLVGLIAPLLVALIYFTWKAGHKQRQEFEHLVRFVFDNRLPPEEARRINASLFYGEKAQLIRHLQILRDSIDIFSTSKKFDTAESRYNTAVEKHQAALLLLPQFVSAETTAYINESFARAAHEFQTQKFTNSASGLIEESRSLKTASARIKRLELARDVLTQGLAAQDSDKSALSRMKADVERQLSELRT